jgi:hypothetical protein
MTEPGLSTRALARRDFLRGALALSAGGAAFYAIGCGGGDDDDPDGESTPSATMASGTPAAGGVQPVLITSEFVLNEPNRFLVGLIGPDGTLVEEAAVNLRFFKIGADGQTGQLRREGQATFLKLEVEGAHAHDGSGGEIAEQDEVSFYGAITPFDEAGKWGVEVNVVPKEEGAEPARLQVPFDVHETFVSVANGAPAPASVNDTAANTPNTDSLCTRDPQCDLHDLVIADVVGKGRPVVVQFSTPAFCETRFCGPVLEVLLEQVPAYRDRIDFVHIEVWQDFQAKVPRPAIGEWGMESEPFTFFVRADGTVMSRLEAIFTPEELTIELDKLLA